ncbi:MAG: GNAT family N-acetyltransferase [Candidatus Zixiibacteriota bacterium]
MDFVSHTQGGEPVTAVVCKGDRVVGGFAGVIVKRVGLRILGSPFPGWSTSYMGFNLETGIDRREAVKALCQFAFSELGCVHLEVMDRHLTREDIRGLGVRCRLLSGFEIDLSRPLDALFEAMTPACRRCIRKSEREGVTVVSVQDDQFPSEYHSQLVEVFSRQSLAPTYGECRVRSLISHLLPTGRLLLARAQDRDGRCIATGIFPAMNGTMYFWGGASSQSSLLLRPNEAVQWFAMRYWRDRGVTKYDMGGGGEYKRKYGGHSIEVPWVRASKFLGIETLREFGRIAAAVKQRLSVSGEGHTTGR